MSRDFLIYLYGLGLQDRHQNLKKKKKSVYMCGGVPAPKSLKTTSIKTTKISLPDSEDTSHFSI